MKLTLIYDQNRNIVATLRTTPQKLKDGKEVMPLFRLHAGQKSHIVDVPDNLKGVELLKHVTKLVPAA